MRKYYLLLLLSLLLCGCKKNDDWIIPKNARMVVSVDFVGLADETDLIDSSVYGLFCRFLKTDPLEMGLDFMEPLTLFELADGSFGVRIDIDDEEKLTDCLTEFARDNVATLPRANGELTWSKLLGEIHLAYNAHTLLMFMNTESSDSHTKQVIKELFSLEYENSFYSTKDHDRMDDIKGKDVVMYANLSALPDNVISFYKSILPQSVKCSDIETVSSFNSEDGRLVIKSEVYSDDEKAQAMLDEHEKALKPICGEYIDGIPQESVVTIMAGIDGDKLCEIIKSVPELSKQVTLAELASGLDIRDKVKTANGDVMICIDEDEPLCVCLNGEELNLSDKWTKQAVEPLPVSEEEVTKQSLFVYMDLEKIDNSTYSRTIPIPSVYKTINQLSAITIRSEGKGDITFTIHSNNKENFLKQLLQ